VNRVIVTEISPYEYFSIAEFGRHVDSKLFLSHFIIKMFHSFHYKSEPVTFLDMWQNFATYNELQLK